MSMPQPIETPERYIELHDQYPFLRSCYTKDDGKTLIMVRSDGTNTIVITGEKGKGMHFEVLAESDLPRLPYTL